jgi:hypothetical protein
VSALSLKAQPKGTRGMSEYRIYFVDEDDHFRGAETIQCATDDEAFAPGLDLIGLFPAVEVWCGTRSLGRIGPNDEWPN